MFNPSRDQARRLFVDAAQKLARGAPLSALEAVAADVVTMHPEYQPLLAEGDAALAHEWTAEQGETNPFLHMALHLAIEEQLSIDQPPGIRAAVAALEARRGDRHAALHEILECLGETVWRATRDRAPPDGNAYLDCIRRRL
jgi:hypothetical protein